MQMLWLVIRSFSPLFNASVDCLCMFGSPGGTQLSCNGRFAFKQIGATCNGRELILSGLRLRAESDHGWRRWSRKELSSQGVQRHARR